jgi:hypothetical protein
MGKHHRRSGNGRLAWCWDRVRYSRAELHLHRAWGQVVIRVLMLSLLLALSAGSASTTRRAPTPLPRSEQPGSAGDALDRWAVRRGTA